MKEIKLTASLIAGLIAFWIIVSNPLAMFFILFLVVILGFLVSKFL